MAKLTTIVVATAISLLLSPTVHAFVSVAPTPARVTKVVLFGAKLEGREIEGTSQQRRDVLQTAISSSLSFALTTMMVGTTFPSAAAAVTDDINNTPPQNVIRAPGLCAYGTGEGCDALSENNVYIQQLQQKGRGSFLRKTLGREEELAWMELNEDEGRQRPQSAATTCSCSPWQQ